MCGKKQASTKLPKDIEQWIGSDDTIPREFIIQAAIPLPKVQVRTEEGKHSFVGVEAPGADQRDEALQKLLVAIQQVAPVQSKLLRSAGAIVVRALPSQLGRIAGLPGIRAILSNRAFGGRPAE